MLIFQPRQGGATMALSIRNNEAERLLRQFAEAENKPITQALIVALKEVMVLRRNAETPRESARRIFAKRGITLPEEARPATPREVFLELDHDDFNHEPEGN
jgi:antitoxin VapB